MLEGLNDILLIIAISVVVLAVIGGVVLLYATNKKKDNNVTEKVVKKVDPNIAKEKIASFLPFDSIEDNMIMMNLGDKFVMLVAANGINYYLMSDVEKEAVEAGFIQILNSLRFPIQIYVQTTSVNLDKSLEAYKDRQKVMEESLMSRIQELQFAMREGNTSEEELNEKRIEIQNFKNVYDYTSDLINNTENITLNQWIIKKNYYIVIPYYLSESGMINRFTEEEVKKIARQELETRASSIIDGLSSMGIEAHIANGDELNQVIYASLNRDDSNIFTFEKAKSIEYDALFKTTEKAYNQLSDGVDKKKRELLDFNF